MPNQNEILQALERLHQRYPTEEVDIWVRWTPSRPEFSFSAKVESPSSYGSTVFSLSWSETPEQAVDSVIERAGDRDPKAAVNKRIEVLKAELAALEAKGPGACPV